MAMVKAAANEVVSVFLVLAAMKQCEWRARLKLTDAVNVVKKNGETQLAAAKKAAMNFMARPSQNVLIIIQKNDKIKKKYQLWDDWELKKHNDVFLHPMGQ